MDPTHRTSAAADAPPLLRPDSAGHRHRRRWPPCSSDDLRRRRPAAPADCPACRTSRPRPSASSTCSSRAAPSQMELFDYKPRLAESARHRTAGFDPQGPAAHRHDRDADRAFPVAPSLFKFAQHGQSGAWVSELLPHTAKIADELCFIKSMHTEAINHDPAVTFFQTGVAARRPAQHRRLARLRPGQRERGPAGVRRDDLARHRAIRAASRSTTACGAAAFCRRATRA